MDEKYPINIESFPSLSGIINKIQKQLVIAQENRIQRFLFLKELELELQYVVVEDNKQKGKFDIKVIGIGGEKKVESQYCHALRVKFECP